jgi:hypothetical protein
MAEIHYDTMNFSFGRPIALDLTSLRELACTEMHRDFFDVYEQFVSEKV